MKTSFAVLCGSLPASPNAHLGGCNFVDEKSYAVRRISGAAVRCPYKNHLCPSALICGSNASVEFGLWPSDKIINKNVVAGGRIKM